LVAACGFRADTLADYPKRRLSNQSRKLVDSNLLSIGKSIGKFLLCVNKKIIIRFRAGTDIIALITTYGGI